MRYSNKPFLAAMSVVALLSLASCVTGSSITKSPLALSRTPLPFVATNVYPTAAYTLTPTFVPSTWILPRSTEPPFVIPNGRILFEGDAIKNGIKTFGFVLLNSKTNKSLLVMEGDQEVGGKTVSLYYPNFTWSPDGHWFAFVGTDVRANVWRYGYQDVYIAKSDGTEVRQLTTSPQYGKFYVSWSPDAKYILVAMGINGSDLYLIDSKSGEIAERLTSDGGAYSAAWSPDGKQIAIGKNSGLSILNVIDGTTKRIDVFPSGQLRDISWSPSNEQVAFIADVNDSNCQDVFMVNVNNGGGINLTSSDKYEKSPVWLPDGKSLVFSRSAYVCGAAVRGGWDIYVTNLMREEHQIVSGAGDYTAVAWAPVPNLETGKQYSITELGANLNLRTEPARNGKILAKLPSGTVITVVEGFVDVDDYYWWKIRTQDGTEGWAVEMANWYKPLSQ